MRYTAPERVEAVAVEPLPHHLEGRQYTATGYGSRIPTEYRVRYRGSDGRARWRRVYVSVWSNAGTAYVRDAGERLILDLDTEHRLLEAAAGTPAEAREVPS